MHLSYYAIEKVVEVALKEDIGPGDVTTLSIVDPNLHARAVFLAKSPLVLCGLEVAALAFMLFDDSCEFETMASDGDFLDGSGSRIGVVSGPAASILTAERVALNFLQRLSGIATLTASFVEAVAGTGAKILDTRKTTPGLRLLEKYAVRVGGGTNHRFGLADGVLIKDNHIAAAGGIANAVRCARKTAPHTLKIEVEVKEFEQIGEALAVGAEVILLDNMPPAVLRSAVEHIAGRALTEASGGVNLSNVRAVAESGVDMISVGALTHSAPASDISLDFINQSEL